MHGFPIRIVGSSTHSSKALSFLQPMMGNIKTHTQSLIDFREGRRNLIIATSVIEEGLDIQDCHLVVCFAPPKNLKSFVQRRGRARRVKSSYIIMLDQFEATQMKDFEALEKEMIRMYSDTTRELEASPEWNLEEEGADKETRIESTGALLTMENAVPHLYHFCN